LENTNIAQLYFSDQVRVFGAVYQNAVTHWYAEHYLGIKLYIKVSERYSMGRQDTHMEYIVTIHKLFTDIKELGKDA
jgi:predicted transposase YbfD/YdcC